MTFVFKSLSTNCYKLVQDVFVLPFLHNMSHVVFTNCYKVLQVHESPRSEITFAKDIVHHHQHKNRLEKVVKYYWRAWAEPGGTAIPGQPVGATKQDFNRHPLFKHTINTRAQRCWPSQVLN